MKNLIEKLKEKLPDVTFKKNNEWEIDSIKVIEYTIKKGNKEDTLEIEKDMEKNYTKEQFNNLLKYLKEKLK